MLLSCESGNSSMQTRAPPPAAQQMRMQRTLQALSCHSCVLCWALNSTSLCACEACQVDARDMPQEHISLHVVYALGLQRSHMQTPDT
jgi:hypothetical protein